MTVKPKIGRRQHPPARLGGEQDVQRLGRGDDDVRRAPPHPVALGLRRVAAAHQRADVHVGQALRRELGADAGERRVEVALNVVRQRLQRRDIDDVRLVRQFAGDPDADQRIDRRKERGERLAGAVGAAISTWRPAWIAGQARDCGSVGAVKLRANQAETAEWKGVRAAIGATENGRPPFDNAGEAKLEGRSASRRMS
jgi:hypothetical protein